MTDHRMPDQPDQPPREVDERLADWVDGRLSERERERLIAEMRVNPQLRADLAQYERTVGVLRAALRAPSTPVRIADRVLDAIAAQQAKPSEGTAARLSGRGLWWSLVCAAALLLGAVWLDSLQPAPSSRTVAATEAAPLTDAAAGPAGPTAATAPVAENPVAEYLVAENMVERDSLEAGIKPVASAGDPAAVDPKVLVLTNAATREGGLTERDKDAAGLGLGISTRAATEAPPGNPAAAFRTPDAETTPAAQPQEAAKPPQPKPGQVEEVATEGRALGGREHAKRAEPASVPPTEVPLVTGGQPAAKAKEGRRGDTNLSEGFERSPEPGASGGARPTAPSGPPPDSRLPAPTSQGAPSGSAPSAPSTPAVGQPAKGRDQPVADGAAPSEGGGPLPGSRLRGAVGGSRRQAEPGHVPLILVEGDAFAAAPVATEAQRPDPLRKSNVGLGLADEAKHEAKDDAKNDAENERAGAPMNAQALQVAVAGFLTASSDPSKDPTAVSLATENGALRLSPLLEGRYELADRQTNDQSREAVPAPKLVLDRTWLVEGARADVEILLAQLAKWTRERKATMRSGETTAPVAPIDTASAATAPGAQKSGTDQELAAAKPAAATVRLILRLKLRAAK